MRCLTDWAEVVDLQRETTCAAHVVEFGLQLDKVSKKSIAFFDASIAFVKQLLCQRSTNVFYVRLVQHEDLGDLKSGHNSEMLSPGSDEGIEYLSELIGFQQEPICYPFLRAKTRMGDAKTCGLESVCCNLHYVPYGQCSRLQLFIQAVLHLIIPARLVCRAVFFILPLCDTKSAGNRRNRPDGLYPCRPVRCADAFPSMLCEQSAYTLVNRKNSPE